jgi:hypothetical protein
VNFVDYKALNFQWKEKDFMGNGCLTLTLLFSIFQLYHGGHHYCLDELEIFGENHIWSQPRWSEKKMTFKVAQLVEHCMYMYMCMLFFYYRNCEWTNCRI